MGVGDGGGGRGAYDLVETFLDVGDYDHLDWTT